MNAKPGATGGHDKARGDDRRVLPSRNTLGGQNWRTKRKVHPGNELAITRGMPRTTFGLGFRVSWVSPFTTLPFTTGCPRLLLLHEVERG
jgi:hypothetical protein